MRPFSIENQHIDPVAETEWLCEGTKLRSGLQHPSHKSPKTSSPNVEIHNLDRVALHSLQGKEGLGGLDAKILDIRPIDLPLLHLLDGIVPVLDLQGCQGKVL